MERRDGLTAAEAAAVFAALAQETRLEAYRLLLRYQPYGLMAGDISRLLAVPHNTLSTHMGILQNAGLVRSRKDGRQVIFVADPARLSEAEAALRDGEQTPETAKPVLRPRAEFPMKRPPDGPWDQNPYKVLVLCSGNTARSIMAEAIINKESDGRFLAFSAGTHPKAAVHPLTLSLLGDLGYETGILRSKSWREFAQDAAPEMDFIVSVCDLAADETCPHWPGQPLVLHWGIPDPAEVKGSPEQKQKAFEEAYRHLVHRFTAFINLPIDDLPLAELKRRLSAIARMDGATDMASHGATPVRWASDRLAKARSAMSMWDLVQPKQRATPGSRQRG